MISVFKIRDIINTIDEGDKLLLGIELFLGNAVETMTRLIQMFSVQFIIITLVKEI